MLDQKNQLNNILDNDNVVDEKAFIEKLVIVESELSIQKIALDQLPERQCTAIMLCTLKGLSNDEAATVMGISVNALESLLARGRRNLKKLYQQIIEEQGYVEKKAINHIH